jgi:hypothetical protein
MTGIVFDSVQPTEHSPSKATLYSTVLPGLGQVYNKKLWKVPAIYAGLGWFTYQAIANGQEFTRYRNGYKASLLGSDSLADPILVTLGFPAGTSGARLRAGRDLYRRNRDLSIMAVGLIYVLQIVDANVDGHLFNFDVSDDLSARWNLNYSHNRPQLALTLSF